MSTLSKAVIINLDKSGKRVECMFNPSEYTFTKSNSWESGNTFGADIPLIDFKGGQPATLSMDLFFDTSIDRKDVRKYTDKLWELMMVDKSLEDPKTKKARPPMVRFQWGKSWTFDAVITSISQNFTLFLSDGTPVRAKLGVTFQQIKDSKKLKPQNPTSGGTGGERTWTVDRGDSLAWIAYKAYGDSTQWRRIADANRLMNVRRLAPGTVLVIPNAE
ncbi:MAG: hypothetical protein RLZZ387_5049 [Chloroflexota bacterium]|jgi:nucleoid-associated protein YgaU